MKKQIEILTEGDCCRTGWWGSAKCHYFEKSRGGTNFWYCRLFDAKLKYYPEKDSIKRCNECLENG